METYSGDDSAVDALPFIAPSEANIFPSADGDAWQATLDRLHGATRLDNGMLGAASDEVAMRA